MKGLLFIYKTKIFIIISRSNRKINFIGVAENQTNIIPTGSTDTVKEIYNLYFLRSCSEWYRGIQNVTLKMILNKGDTLYNYLKK